MFNTLRITTTSILFTIFFALFGAIETANAHSFNVLLIQDGADSGDVYDAFRLATKERDGHPNEESDGHLGGLDVYIFTVDNFDILMKDSFSEFTSAFKSADPDFVIFLGTLVPDDSVSTALLSLDFVSVEVPEITAQTQAAFLDSIQSGDNSFRDRFRRGYSHDPSDTATLAYIAARLIDFAVRDQGDVDDRDALRKSLEKLR